MCRYCDYPPHDRSIHAIKSDIRRIEDRLGRTTTLEDAVTDCHILDVLNLELQTREAELLRLVRAI
jgi:hypothetical protein